MRRRGFLMATSAAFGLSGGARAQRGPIPTIGFLNGTSPDTYAFTVAAFREGLKGAGFVEGQNVRIEYRWAHSDYGRLPALAAELVAAGVQAIAATGDVASARAAQAATKTIPVVFTIGPDPVRFGLVASLHRPGANVTGVSLLSPMLGAKRMELLHEIAPRVRRIALLMNPDNSNRAAEQRDAEAGARSLGLETVALEARNEAEINEAFAELERRGADAITTASDPIMLSRRQQIVMLASRKSLPGMYFEREFVEVGGLVSYGPSIRWMYRQAGAYIGMILKGMNPAELPVLQPTLFEFVVNLKTAGRLGLDVPPGFLARVDEAIE